MQVLTVTWLRTVKKFLLRCTASYRARRTASFVLNRDNMKVQERLKRSYKFKWLVLTTLCLISFKFASRCTRAWRENKPILRLWALRRTECGHVSRAKGKSRAKGNSRAKNECHVKSLRVTYTLHPRPDSSTRIKTQKNKPLVHRLVAHPYYYELIS